MKDGGSLDGEKNSDSFSQVVFFIPLPQSLPPCTGRFRPLCPSSADDQV